MIRPAICLAFFSAVQPEAPTKVVHRDVLILCRSQSFKIPFAVDRETKCVRLFISTDLGKTWKKYAEATPDKKIVTVTVPKDGIYWFAAQTVGKNRLLNPEKISEPTLKVLVNSQNNPKKDTPIQPAPPF
jgi:hypothetical protein